MPHAKDRGARPTATVIPGPRLSTLAEIRDVQPPSAQYSFDELGDPLRDITFVVVDLETTGGSSAEDSITEFGAVKVRGGEMLGEFATLVDPGRAIPPQITVLTGISDSMVFNAPRIGAVLPPFLEFIRGTVLVAHNAGFDIGFLKAACRRLDLPWPGNQVVDTVKVARAVLTRDEAPSVRLSALAMLFGARTRPDHRALHDARATVDVLHGLFERVGGLGVQNLSELQQLSRNVPAAHRRKRQLAEHLPAAPGIYLFKGRGGEVLYVGTSRNLRQRVRSYFGASEKRGRMRQMVGLAERVDYVECSHALEALVREQRMIAAHQPAFNRRSRQPSKVSWVTLTSEAFPRLSIVTVAPSGPSGTACLGPFSSRADAQVAVEAIQEVVRIRRCSQRLSRRPSGTACALAELGKCGAPCAGLESQENYAGHVQRIVSLVSGVSDEILSSLKAVLQRLSEQGRFDQAALVRDRLSALAGVTDRRQRLAGLSVIAELVVAQADGKGGWDLAVIRHGRLAAAGRAVRGVDPMPVIDLLCRSAETVLPGPGPLPAASAEETITLLRWLERPGTRLVSASSPWSSPAQAAGRWRSFVSAAGLARNVLRGLP